MKYDIRRNICLLVWEAFFTLSVPYLYARQRAIDKKLGGQELACSVCLYTCTDLFLTCPSRDEGGQQ